MQAVVRRAVVLLGGVAGAAAGWVVGTALAPDLADIAATAGAFLGVVVAGLALAAREYDPEEEGLVDPEDDG